MVPYLNKYHQLFWGLQQEDVCKNIMKILVYCPIEMFYSRHTYLYDHVELFAEILVSIITVMETWPPESY